MKKTIAISIFVVCAVAAAIFVMHGPGMSAQRQARAYPYVNMERLATIQGPTYNGLSYKEDYSKLPSVAERHKLFDRSRMPANEPKKNR